MVPGWIILLYKNTGWLEVVTGFPSLEKRRLAVRCMGPIPLRRSPQVLAQRVRRGPHGLGPGSGPASARGGPESISRVGSVLLGAFWGWASLVAYKMDTFWGWTILVAYKTLGHLSGAICSGSEWGWINIPGPRAPNDTTCPLSG